MCVIIVKPAGRSIPARLLEAAASLNRDGWGLMALRPDGSVALERRSVVRVPEIAEALAGLEDSEVALHLRLRTAGDVSVANVHPFEVTEGLYLMHNGTLDVARGEPGRSDTWHLSHGLLGPLARQFEGLLTDPAFVSLLESGLGADNKLVLLDQRQRRLSIVNARHGVELDGLWLSTSRWIDRRLYTLPEPDRQERSYLASELQFL